MISGTLGFLYYSFWRQSFTFCTEASNKHSVVTATLFNIQSNYLRLKCQTQCYQPSPGEDTHIPPLGINEVQT